MEQCNTDEQCLFNKCFKVGKGLQCLTSCLKLGWRITKGLLVEFYVIDNLKKLSRAQLYAFSLIKPSTWFIFIFYQTSIGNKVNSRILIETI